MPPKTASNSIRSLLENLGYEFSKNFRIVHPQIHLKLSEILDIYNVENLEGYKIMQVVRDPYQRFVSSFYYQKKVLPANHDSKLKNLNFSEFSNHLYDAKKTNDFIKNFYGDESYINRCIHNGDGWGGSRLFDTQASWDTIGTNVKYFKLENLSSDVSELESYLETPINKFPKLNSQDLQNYDSLITPEIKQIVTELFQEDFDKFGYIK